MQPPASARFEINRCQLASHQAAKFLPATVVAVAQMRLLQLLRLAVILRLSLALLEPPIRIKPRYVAPRASLTAAGAARRLNHLQGHAAPTPGDVAVLPSHLRETELRARGGVHFNVTLVGDTWVAGLGVEQELTELWLREVRPPAIYSRRGELLAPPHGWAAEVAPHLTPSHVLRVSDTTLMVSIDWAPSYDCATAEFISAPAPWWAVAKNVSAEPLYRNISIEPTTPSITTPVGLVADGGVSEEALASETHTLQLVLDGCDWALDAGTRGSAAFAALADAIDGPLDVQARPGASGWNLAGRGELIARRQNASHLTLTVPPLPAYDIDSPETVSLTVPAAALLQHHAPVAAGSFVVRAAPGRARLRGELLRRNASERKTPPSIAGKSLELALVADRWAPALYDNVSVQRALVRGLASAQDEPLGWNTMVRSQLDAVRHVRRNESGKVTYDAIPLGGLGNLTLAFADDGRALTLTLPHDAPYVISRPETITATIPKAALASGSADVVATPPLRLAAVGGSARVRGTFIADEVPASFVNETIFEYLILALPPALRLGWVADLADFDSEATIDLLSTIERALLHINDTSYDVFDVTCFAPPPPPPGVNLTFNVTNATNGSNATNLTNFTNATAALLALEGSAATFYAALLNLTPNASNATNGTNLTSPMSSISRPSGPLSTR